MLSLIRFSIATYLDLPPKSEYIDSHNFMMNANNTSIMSAHRLNSIGILKAQNTNEPNRFSLNNEKLQIGQNEHSTYGQYQSANISEDVSNLPSKDTSSSGSPLVVLPLPTGVISYESEDSTNTFLQNGNIANMTRNGREAQHPTRYMSRVNELADYAKKYEDLYSRRMGGLNFNSSTSGSIPSASGSCNRNRKQFIDENKVRCGTDNTLSSVPQERVKSPILPPSSPLSLQLNSGESCDYRNYSKNHHNIIQWVKNQHSYSSEAVIMQPSDNLHYTNSDLSHKNEQHCKDQLYCKTLSDVGTVECCSPNIDTSNSTHEQNTFSCDNTASTRSERRGSPNTSGLPNIEPVNRRDVKSLVSAFNEQIESQKVWYNLRHMFCIT